ncbi:Uncharacterised protein [Klebsiella pneumoniae]|nr:hypothetical protein [Klebsiella pneumoniae]SVL75250.1 Uncharacterised protein [Klebsiella pneumoniae]
MARELKKRRQAETSTPVEDDYLANMLWYAEESFVTPTQIINASLAVWLRLVLLPPLSANSCSIAGLRKIIGRWYTHPALSFSAKMVWGNLA